MLLDRFLRLLAPYLLPIALSVLAGTTAWALVQTWRVHTLERDLSVEQSERATERATAEAIGRAMAERNASLQAIHAARQQEATRAYTESLAAQKVAADAAAADADLLRDAVACYAAGDCIGPRVDAATGGTCADRAATLGKLFGRADTLAARMARAADRHADEVRSLKRQLLLDRATCGVGQDGVEKEQ
jgi:hypothetical protein